MRIFQIQIVGIFLISSIEIDGIILPQNSIVEDFLVVSLKNDNTEDAYKVAARNGFEIVQKIDGFTNVFLFKKKVIKREPMNENKMKMVATTTNDMMIIENVKRSKNLSVNRNGQNTLFHINDEDDVLWVSQQHLLKRSKRDFPIYNINEIAHYLDYQDIYFRHSRRRRRHHRPFFNDELWDQQWYMQKSSKDKHRKQILGLNVLPVYERGITGKGVRVAVIDDGLEYDHDDLIQNYDPLISWNCNDDNSSPYPNITIKYQNMDYGNHGTRCAGEIAMSANNKKCGVGVAFNARIGGIKLLDGAVYDLIEGVALGYAYEKIDIYSCSWGPPDDGETLERPGKFAYESIKRGINKGRNGLGSIYVWASGNGGKNNDNCNCDGYAGSKYTISVGSVTQTGGIPWYSEKCAALMTVTCSSGTITDQMITTTDIGNSCTTNHTGTSASAPLAAGIIALGLEANPYLTWRDVQHIIVKSSEYFPLSYHENWMQNSAGYFYNTHFGFGLMNAQKFVNLAERWKSESTQYKEYVESTNIYQPMKYFLNQANQYFEHKLNNIKYLEHVEITVNINCQIRGSIEITLISPSDTKVKILESRSNDKSMDCYQNWTFMSVATWSENPYGKWILDIHDVNGNRTIESINKSTLTFYGTKYLRN